MIRILQISDIHFLNCEEEDDNYSQLRQRLLDDVDNLVGVRGAVEVILVCGDIANKGQKAEYVKARAFLEDLATHCHCSLDRVFLVPGNHDVDRSNHSFSRDFFRQVFFDKKANNDALKSFREKEPLALALAYAPFENYREMALVFDSNDELTQAIIDGEVNLSKKKLYWKKFIGSESGYDVHVIGINTALISGKDDFDLQNGTGQKMFLPKCSYQLKREKNEIYISMMHHPVTHILDGSNIEKKLDSRFQIQLYGHMHKQSSDVSNAIKIYSGSLQPGEPEEGEYVPIYNLLELYVNDMGGKKRLTVDLYSRQGNDMGFVLYKQEKVPLSVSLEYNNQWAVTIPRSTGGNDTQQETTGTTVTMKHTVNELNYLFLTISNAKSIMRKMYADHYDARLSDKINRLRFLQRVKKDNKYEELDKLIP